MNTYLIDLEKFRTKGSRVFSGRPRGRKVREASGINELETTYDKIEIQIPEDIGSINPSFLEEFLFHVVKKLGTERFLKKFEFISLGRYNIQTDLEDAIDRILKRQNALIED